MIEAIVASSRAIACDAKLLIFYHLTKQPELPSSQIARRARLTQDDASHHLAELAKLGLVRRRRAGTWVHYSLGLDAPPSTLAGAAGLVRRACLEPSWATAGWKERRTLHLAPTTIAKLPSAQARALDVVFDAATAFTHGRRVMIVRWLRANGPTDAAAIVSSLRMSLQARQRHLEKLERRGYVVEVAPARWALAPHTKSRFHGEFLDALLTWAGPPTMI